eukprot:838294-Prymnesium_polylepis.2
MLPAPESARRRGARQLRLHIVLCRAHAVMVHARTRHGLARPERECSWPCRRPQAAEGGVAAAHDRAGFTAGGQRRAQRRDEGTR